MNTSVCTVCRSALQDENEPIYFGKVAVCPGCKEVYEQVLREGGSNVPRVDSEAIRLREAHFSFERSGRALGRLYALLGVGLGGMGFFVLIYGMTTGQVRLMLLGGFHLLMGPGGFVLLDGFEKRKGWMLFKGKVLCGIGLLAFPFGFLLGVVALTHLNDKRASLVYSRKYDRIIELSGSVDSG